MVARLVGPMVASTVARLAVALAATMDDSMADEMEARWESQTVALMVERWADSTADHSVVRSADEMAVSTVRRWDVPEAGRWARGKESMTAATLAMPPVGALVGCSAVVMGIPTVVQLASTKVVTMALLMAAWTAVGLAV